MKVKTEIEEQIKASLIRRRNNSAVKNMQNDAAVYGISLDMSWMYHAEKLEKRSTDEECKIFLEDARKAHSVGKINYDTLHAIEKLCARYGPLSPGYPRDPQRAKYEFLEAMTRKKKFNKKPERASAGSDIEKTTAHKIHGIPKVSISTEFKSSRICSDRI